MPNEIDEFLNREGSRLGECCLVRHGDDVGVAFRVGEVLSNTYRSGDSIVFWRNGDHTATDGCERIKNVDFWSLVNDATKKEPDTDIVYSKWSNNVYPCSECDFIGSLLMDNVTALVQVVVGKENKQLEGLYMLLNLHGFSLQKSVS